MAVAATDQSAHRLGYIQGLRAVAVLAVIAFHAGLPLPGGFVGVDVFFVVSGFVITAMLHREWLANGRIRLAQFYWRRFFRLVPALAVVVAFTMIASALLLAPGVQRTASFTGLGAMLLSANLMIVRFSGGYFDSDTALNPLLNTWSLSVEEQFYILFPALLILGWLIARRSPRLRNAPTVIIVLFAIASFGLMLLALTTPEHTPAVLGFYSPVPRAWEFAVGALLFLLSRQQREHQPHRQVLSGIAGVAGSVLLIVSFVWLSEATPFPSFWTLLPVGGTLLLLYSGLHGSHLVSRALASRPMVAIGDRSYSLYLWHWPLIVFAEMLFPETPIAPIGAALISVAFASASYKWVEQPARTRRVVRLKPRLMFATALVTVPIVLAGGVLIGQSRDWGNDDVREFTAIWAGKQAGCSGALPEPRTLAKCSWNAGATGYPVYLFGDSNAQQFSDGVIRAGSETNHPVQVWPFPSCPPMSELEIRNNAECTRWSHSVFDYLDTAPAGLVILGFTNSNWYDPETQLRKPDGTFTADSAEKIELLTTALSAAVARLQGSGHTVVLTQSVPKWQTFAPDATHPTMIWNIDQCTMIALFTQNCNATRSAEDLLADTLDARAAVSQIARTTGALMWDLTDDLCPAGICNVVRPNGDVVYLDFGHISKSESERLAPIFARLLPAEL